MTEKQTILTAEGLEKLKAELNELRTVKRLENEERLHEAISHGDLSENSEYDAAKDEQARIEGRVQEIEQMKNKTMTPAQLAEILKDGLTDYKR